jgi:hypothetical protein
MEDEEKVRWFLQWFPVDGDDLVGELEVGALTKEEGRAIVEMPAADPLVGMFRLDERAACSLKSYIDVNFDFTRYEYFLGRFAVS